MTSYRVHPSGGRGGDAPLPSVTGARSVSGFAYVSCCDGEAVPIDFLNPSEGHALQLVVTFLKQLWQ